MSAENFINLETLEIIVLGIIAFALTENEMTIDDYE
jgi:Na+-transporting methylmalonyl-CoA/oxaloacetate decarboxylase beta subunit